MTYEWIFIAGAQMQTEMVRTRDQLVDASKNISLTESALYPLRFKPIYQYRPWGGRRLAELITEPMPSGAIGEAWLFSDRDDHASQVADGPLKGWTIGQLLKQFPKQMLGRLAHRFQRFPVLLKFLDAQEMLSVQVHPTKANANLLPADETAKSEAWVVLEAGAESRIYAGLKAGTTAADLRRGLADGTVVEQLEGFTPKVGDSVFIKAGTVHSLGGDVVVFEIQQNSDVTFRLYDWGHVDAKTSKLRELQVDQAMDCIDFTEGPVGRITPVLESATPVKRERLFDCEYFQLWRIGGELPFSVGAVELPRVLVCIDGGGEIEQGYATYAIGKGDVLFLPAVMGPCTLWPRGAVNLLEIALPE
jgi:mannose-6-phosphate isomerase